MAIRGVPAARRAISQAPALVDADAEDVGGAHDDRLQLVGVVVVEPGDEPEAIAQRPGDHARPRGGADERERRQRQADARRRRALADDDVELEVLHRRVEDLLDGPRQPVDLVDEQHVVVAELGEDGGQVAGALERRAGRDVQVHAHLGGDDRRQRRLAEARRAGEEQVVDGLLAAAGRLEHDAEVLLQLALADELVEAARPQSGLDGVFDVVVERRDRGTRHARLAPSRLERVAQHRRRVGVAGQLAHALADLVGAVAEPGERLAHRADGRARPMPCPAPRVEHRHGEAVAQLDEQALGRLRPDPGTP